MGRDHLLERAALSPVRTACLVLAMLLTACASGCAVADQDPSASTASASTIAGVTPPSLTRVEIKPGEAKRIEQFATGGPLRGQISGEVLRTGFVKVNGAVKTIAAPQVASQQFFVVDGKSVLIEVAPEAKASLSVVYGELTWGTWSGGSRDLCQVAPDLRIRVGKVGETCSGCYSVDGRAFHGTLIDDGSTTFGNGAYRVSYHCK